jgi:eukaryotic-like serine/threonine-protein kinase
MKRIADYELIESLGRGNHGEYFVAQPPARLGLDVDRVAVKVLGLNATEDAFRRVANELRLFASVSCPQLVTLYDAGQQAGTLYYAMEFFPEGSLESPATELSRARILRALADAARAAHALHEAGVAHRDIKPANVMLADEGAKLSDLGLAQILSPGQTVTGIGPIGTIEFMEPGIILGERAGRASDIWALGITAHRAVTGRSVFGEIPGGELIAALRHVLETPPSLAEGLSDAEAELISWCLRSDRADRPASAAEVAERLDDLAVAA